MNGEILIPLDGSELAESIIPHALAYANGSAILRLVRVVSDLHMPAMLAPGMELPVSTVEQSAERAMNYLSTVAQRVEKCGASCALEVLVGDPATAIIERANDEQIALVAMTTHGRHGLGRWVFGSVAESVLRRIHRPLLLVRAGGHAVECAAATPTTILVPLDGSLLAEQALAPATELALRFNATIRLLAALPTLDELLVESDGFGVPSIADVLEEQRRLITTYLNAKARGLIEQGLTVRREVLHGRAAALILELSTQKPDTLVVMATHGYGGLRRLWLGSVALKVVQGSETPLLLIRPEKISEEQEQARAREITISR